MYNFTVPMALMDYLPVIFFGVTAPSIVVRWSIWLHS